MAAQVQINPTYLIQQAGKQPNFGFKEFYYGGVSYTLSGTQINTVPDVVATAWNAADSDVIIVSRT